MKLTKAQREQVRTKFDGLCSYCGCHLGRLWHADHLEPVLRDSIYEPHVGFRFTGGLARPERDTFENLMPSCPPCNIDKHAAPLEVWREKLQRGPATLAKNNSTYRHSIRFGLLSEIAKPVVFYFETLTAARAA